MSGPLLRAGMLLAICGAMAGCDCSGGVTCPADASCPDGEVPPDGDVGSDGDVGGECRTDSDCTDTPPCTGTYACSEGRCRLRCDGCTDADGDGYGEGDECLGADCDDTDIDANPGAVERCNGADDDCDGASDEDLADLVCGVGACARTAPSCVSGAPGSCIPGEATGETCDDGVDDDCDGDIDEGCVCTDTDTQACFSGPGALRGVGACVEGAQTCSAGAWGACEGEGMPSAERCNGDDDDCDGSTDEGLGSETCGTGACQRTVDRCTGGVPTSCTPGTPAAAETCDDGIDDDCDGTADDGCECTDSDTQACFGGDPALRGVGACVEGTQLCSGGAWGLCTGDGMPSAERCNGDDDDCDGSTDEGFSVGSACDGTDADLCEEGVLMCDGSGGVACDDTTGDTLELCNGLDDDCDGSNDEGFSVGSACDGADADLCEEGVLMCDGSGGVACDDTTGDTLELCNGLDDDCDGSTADGSGDPAIGPACDGPDGDSCLEGTVACVGGAPACTDATDTTVEVCGNGLDDDCNGSIDDGCVPCVPSAEACNGVDDDCDGTADEGLGTFVCGVGACRREVAACVGGVVQTCTPGAPAAEVCGDGVDNNCDGTTDELASCPCAYVRPDLPGPATCSMAASCGSIATPCCTITLGIAAAMASGVDRVCVAANLTAGGACTAYDYVENVTMYEDLALHGNYHPTAWTRGNAACVTRIVGTDAVGVLFPAGTTRATEIDGFVVRAWESLAIAGPVAAVTFDASSGIIANCAVEARNTNESYGIDVRSTSGTDSPLVTRTFATGGTTNTTTAAIRCTGARPEIVAGPPVGAFAYAIDGGAGAGGPAFRTAYGIRAVGCAGMRVEDYSIRGGGTTTGQAAGVRFEGDSSGAVVRGSRINGGNVTGGGDAHGVWLASCTGSEPWIVSNTSIWGGSNTSALARAYGVYAQAGCDAAIETNADIAGGNHPALVTIGVACVGGAMCTIQRNTLIRGSWGAAEDEAVGVHCGPGSCRDLTGNVTIRGGGTFERSIGVRLDRADPVVDDNFIDGGCGPTLSVGLELLGSGARVTNNVITGCTPSSGAVPMPPQVHGVRQTSMFGAGEPDVHSNTIDGGRVPVACTGRAVSILGATGAPAQGVYRNNVLHAGMCTTNRYGLQEMTPDSDPRVVSNNDFWNAPAADGMYRNEGTTAVNTAVAINALSDITSGGNIVADPGFVSGFADVHLAAGSMCVDAGTSTGAPAIDMDGQARPRGAGYDIGADER